MYKFIINKEKCINCGICMKVCRNAGVYKMINGKVEAAFKYKCWECGQCIAACPKSAVEYCMSTDLGDISVLPEHICNNDSIIESFRKRRSVRLFDDKPVSRGIVEELLDCTRWIPSAQNKCDTEWVCMDDREKIKYLSGKTVEVFKKTAQLLKNPVIKPFIRIALGNNKYKQAIGNINSFERLVSRYDEGEDPIFYNAPVLLFTTTPADSYFGKENSIYAGYNLMVNAADKGLSTCRIGYFDAAMQRDKLLQNIILGENSNRKIQTTIILGYSKYKFYNLVDRDSIKINWDHI